MRRARGSRSPTRSCRNNSELQRRDAREILAGVGVEERLFVRPRHLRRPHCVEETSGADRTLCEGRGGGRKTGGPPVHRAEWLQMSAVHRDGGIVALEGCEQRLEE